MKKMIPLALFAIPLFGFDLREHVVPDTQSDTFNQGYYYNTQGYEFPNDPQSNNYFDDPNWPNTHRQDRYNYEPENAYYTSPNSNYQLPPEPR